MRSKIGLKPIIIEAELQQFQRAENSIFFGLKKFENSASNSSLKRQKNEMQQVDLKLSQFY
uniref:Uncharacterized protein n=1 Tax=Solanum tuberosum TaxID=4113 RepID=M1BJS7_SOLTU